MLIALAAAQPDWVPATPSIHRLGLGLPGYLILFAPLAFAPQRQLWSSAPLSPQVFLPISTHFTATPGLLPPVPSSSSRSKGVYIPRDFILHAALLRQGFPHCAKFPTAASRRSLDRVSVPVCPCALSGRILILALVGRYLTS